MKDRSPKDYFDFRISQVGEYHTPDKQSQGFIDEVNIILFRDGRLEKAWHVKPAKPKTAPPVFFPFDEDNSTEAADTDFVMYIRPVINNLGIPNLQNFSLKIDTVSRVKEPETLTEVDQKTGHELIRAKLSGEAQTYLKENKKNSKYGTDEMPFGYYLIKNDELEEVKL